MAFIHSSAYPSHPKPNTFILFRSLFAAFNTSPNIRVTLTKATQDRAAIQVKWQGQVIGGWFVFSVEEVKAILKDKSIAEYYVSLVDTHIQQQISEHLITITKS